MKYIFVALWMFVFSSFAFAQFSSPDIYQNGKTLVIKNDFGGAITEYMIRYQKMKIDGASLVIDGECDSACTMFMGFIPPQNTCVTENAKIGIHRASRPEGTMYLMMLYPFTVKLWIMTEGITEDIKYLPQELVDALWVKCTVELDIKPKGEKVDP